MVVVMAEGAITMQRLDRVKLAIEKDVEVG